MCSAILPWHIVMNEPQQTQAHRQNENFPWPPRTPHLRVARFDVAFPIVPAPVADSRASGQLVLGRAVVDRGLGQG